LKTSAEKPKPALGGEKSAKMVMPVIVAPGTIEGETPHLTVVLGVLVAVGRLVGVLVGGRGVAVLVEGVEIGLGVLEIRGVGSGVRLGAKVRDGIVVSA
jgi:hypothetical protein